MPETSYVTSVTDEKVWIVPSVGGDPQNVLGTLESDRDSIRAMARDELHQAVMNSWDDLNSRERDRLRDHYETHGMDSSALPGTSSSSDDAPYTDDGSPGGYENPYLADDNAGGDRQAVLSGGGIPWLLVGAAGVGLVGVFILARPS